PLKLVGRHRDELAFPPAVAGFILYLKPSQNIPAEEFLSRPKIFFIVKDSHLKPYPHQKKGRWGGEEWEKLEKKEQPSGDNPVIT
ncbi:hypothetical protein SK128_001059, partial [Halocaridina rubra]